MSSKLIKADTYNEEDVIEGLYKGSRFYFSEIHLENENDESSSTKFRGLLFNLHIPVKNFPYIRIQSHRNLAQLIFSKFIKHKSYDFWYETENEAAFESTMNTLLPFLSYLKKQQGEIRLYTKGANITLIMESKMKFLDESEQKLDLPLDRLAYKTNLAKQLNTLLFIVDAFINDLDSSDIVDQLELKAIENADNALDNNHLDA